MAADRKGKERILSLSLVTFFLFAGDRCPGSLALSTGQRQMVDLSLFVKRPI
jgi:hypothetical protein